jgi:hypothetical protein
MLARPERRYGHLGMERIRRRNGNNLDLGVGDQRSPVARSFLETELLSLAPAHVFGHLRQVHQPGPQRFSEHRPHARPGQRVALAHIAGSDKPNPDRCGHLCPPVSEQQ